MPYIATPPPPTFHERLAFAMERRGFTQTSLAAALTSRTGKLVKPQVIQHLATKASRSGHIADLCAILNISDEWLARGMGDMNRPDAIFSVAESPIASLPKNGYTRCPVVGTASLGLDGYWLELEYPAGDGDGFIDSPTRDANAYALRVRGDSMHPAIRSGWYVIVEPNAPVQVGEYVLAKLRDGRSTVKELLWRRGGEVALIAVNGGERLTVREEEIEILHHVAMVAPPSMRRV